MDPKQLNNDQMDALIRQVFGEPEASDLQIVQSAPADVVAAEETILRNVRHTLGTLSDVPECQLDFSRVQRVIAGGVGEPRNRWRWLGYAVPVAACAAFAIWLGGRPLTTVPEPTDSGQALHGAGAVASNDPAPGSGFTVPSEAAPPKPVQIDPVPSTTTKPVELTRRSPSRPYKPTKRANTIVAKVAPVAESTLAEIASSAVGLLMGGGGGASAPAAPMVMDRSAEPKVMSDTVGAAAAGMVSNFDAPKEPRTIVVVGGGSSMDSRASSAMEVDKRDVVFGG